MFKRIIQSFVVLGMLVGITLSNPKQQMVVHEPVMVKTEEYTGWPARYIEAKTMIKSKMIGLSNEDVDLLALVIMAEAEGETELGKRLVIDTILNRVDSDYFPNTVKEVIYQPNAFSSMSDGRVEKCYVTDDIRKLVMEELENRTNHDVMYFCAGKYSEYGSPMFVEGGHYFSSYN